MLVYERFVYCCLVVMSYLILYILKIFVAVVQLIRLPFCINSEWIYLLSYF